MKTLEISMRSGVRVMFAVVAGLTYAGLASGQDLAVCQTIQEDKARLTCFDALAKAATSTPQRAEIASTTAVVTPSAPGQFRAANLQTMLRQPLSSVGKPLLFRQLRCTYVDVNDYRCAAEHGKKVEVRARIVVPPPMQTAVEARCGTLYRDRPKACIGDVGIVPTAVRTDGGAGLVVEAPSIIFRIGRR